MRPLRRDVRGQTIGVIPQAKCTAGLHGRDAAAVAAEAFADDDIGGVESLLDLRVVPRLIFRRRAAGQRHLEDQVAVPAVMDDRRARLERRLGVADIGEFLVVDLDRFGGVLGHILVARDHGRQRIAMEAHLTDRKRPMGRILGRHVGDHDRLRQGRDLILDVVTGDHRDNPGHGLGSARVDALDPGMGHLAAHEHQVQHAWRHDVGNVASATGGQPLVFLATEFRAEPAVRCAGVHRVVHVFAPWMSARAAQDGNDAVSGRTARFAASRTASTICT